MAYRQAVLRRADDQPIGGGPPPGSGNGVAAFRLPCADQTAASVARWLEGHAKRSSIVAVRHDHRQLFEYHLDEIVKINPRSRRVHLAFHGTFDFAGAGISAPKHSLALLEPTAPVLTAAAEGRTWQHGRPAFKRPLATREVELARIALERFAAKPSGGES